MKNHHWFYDVFLVACFFLFIPTTSSAFFSGDIGKGEDRLQEALTLFERGQDEAAEIKIDEAREYFIKVLAKSKINEADLARAYENMGYCHWLRRQEEHALDNFKRATGNNKAKRRILKFLDDEYNKTLAKKNFDRSFVINSYAVDLNPGLKTELIEVYTEAAKMWLNQENRIIAKAYLYQVIMMDSSQREEATRLLYEAGCYAYVTPEVLKRFDCYNLAAIGKTTYDNPLIPSWRLIGGYWQWGRKGPDPSQWYDTNTPNFAHGPTGPNSGDANSGAISGWSSSNTPNGSWSDSQKTSNDPCPAGYRVPTITQWQGVLDNNSQSTVGSWSNSATNYTSARVFGSELLMLPAAGNRDNDSGALDGRGYSSYYWSSSEYAIHGSLYLHFNSGIAHAIGSSYRRLYGHSVRCIAE
jgi:uncharacterized protein (TIGR02145 family)